MTGAQKPKITSLYRRIHIQLKIACSNVRRRGLWSKKISIKPYT